MVDILNFIFKPIILICKPIKLYFNLKEYKKYIISVLEFIQDYNESTIKYSYECHMSNIEQRLIFFSAGKTNDALFEGSIYEISKQYQLIDKDRKMLTKILSDTNLELVYEQYNSQSRKEQFYFVVRDCHNDIIYKMPTSRYIKHINMNCIVNLKEEMISKKWDKYIKKELIERN